MVCRGLGSKFRACETVNVMAVKSRPRRRGVDLNFKNLEEKL